MKTTLIMFFFKQHNTDIVVSSNNPGLVCFKQCSNIFVQHLQSLCSYFNFYCRPTCSLWNRPIA